MKGLGRLFNVVGFASGIHISLEDAAGVTFVCYSNGGAQNITIKESIDGSPEQALEVVTELYSSSGVGGVWIRETEDANGALGTGDAAIVKKDSTAYDTAVFYIGADELSDTYNNVEVAVNTGTVMAIVHDILVPRDPVKLVSAGA